MEVRANGVDFVCETYGEGEPLLCLHGFPDDPDTFEPLAEHLDDYRLVAPYMRGYGPTGDAPDGDYSARALGRDAVALADELGADRLFGHDWGAVAAYAAMAGGADFESVAAAAVPPRFVQLLPRYPRQLLRSWYIWAFQLPGAVDRLRARDYAMVDLLWETWSPGADDREHRESVKETLDEGTTAANAVAYYRAIVRDSAPDLLGGLPDPADGPTFETPTLVLAGADDGCIGPALFRDGAVVDAFAGRKRIVEVRDAGHFVHRERPAAVADELASFL